MDVIDSSLQLERIWISQGHDFRGRHGLGRKEHQVIELAEVECVAGRGLVGDRYFDYQDDFKGQVSFFSAEILAEIREKFGEIDPSGLRRNFLVAEGNLASWIGRKFSLQGVIFEGSEECKPCYWMDQVIGDGAEDFLKGKCRGGLRARILTDGKIRKSTGA